MIEEKRFKNLARPMSIALIALLLLLATGTGCQSKRHHDSKASEASALGRSMGGENRVDHREPLSFMVPLYRGSFYGAPASKDGDGYLTGFGLLLRNLTMLVPDGVAARASIVAMGRRVLVGWAQDKKAVEGSKTPGWMPPTLDPNEHQWHALAPAYVLKPLAKQAGGVSLVRLELESARQLRDRTGPNITVPKRLVPPVKYLHTSKFTQPKLNSNRSLSENCYVYSYSRPYASKNRNDLRTFARWPVKLMKCNNSNHTCTFINDIRPRRAGPKQATGGSSATKKDKKLDGLICHTWHDVGAPVMCSSEREPSAGASASELANYESKHLKLSYMVLGSVASPNASTQVDCMIAFKVLRLADFYETLK